MEDSEVLTIANEICSCHGLVAKFLGDVKSVGVGGDHRSYTRIILLEGPFPGNEVLSEISTKISNVTGINRVAYSIASS